MKHGMKTMRMRKAVFSSIGLVCFLALMAMADDAHGQQGLVDRPEMLVSTENKCIRATVSVSTQTGMKVIVQLWNIGQDTVLVPKADASHFTMHTWDGDSSGSCPAALSLVAGVDHPYLKHLDSIHFDSLHPGGVLTYELSKPATLGSTCIAWRLDNVELRVAYFVGVTSAIGSTASFDQLQRMGEELAFLQLLNGDSRKGKPMPKVGTHGLMDSWEVRKE